MKQIKTTFFWKNEKKSTCRNNCQTSAFNNLNDKIQKKKEKLKS